MESLYFYWDRGGSASVQGSFWFFKAMKTDYIAVIQAGGMGSRMKELTLDKIPKPMLLLNGKPMLEWQILNIKKYGIKEFVIIIGHLGEKVKEYFGDGSKLEVKIQYIEENVPLGSAGALAYLKSITNADDFLLIYGDVMFDLNWHRFIDFHEKNAGKATLLAHPNAHPYDSDLLIINKEYCVTDIDSKNNKRDYWYDNCVNAGIYILSSEIFENITEVKKMDLEQDIIVPLIKERMVYAYCTPEYVKDAGTPERFNKVSKEQQMGVWDGKNLTNKQRCVFLDRDGTLNQYRGLISKEEQLELEKNAAKAVLLLNEAGYLVIVVTNQPVVARGMCEIEDVEYIHKKLQTLLGREQAYVDDIVFCPHHPDKGYPDENPLYKIECECRKPKIGMIEKMREKYNIDLEQSYMVGDTTIDIETGKNAGLKTVLVLTGEAGADGKYNVQPDIKAKDVLEAVTIILQNGS